MDARLGQLDGSRADEGHLQGEEGNTSLQLLPDSLPFLLLIFPPPSFYPTIYLLPFSISLPPCTYPRLAFSLSFSPFLSPLPHPSSSSIDQSPQL